MARQLKVFRTHLGFHDLIVAAPSKKAALEAWGAGPHLFSQGFAAETTEPELVEAALKKPGVVLRRQFGSTGEFRENGEDLQVPKASAAEAAARRAKERQHEREREREREREDEREKKAKATAVRAELQAEAAREREEHAAAQAAEARDKTAAAERRRAEKAAALAEQAAKAELRAELQSLTQQRKDQLRDIERREAAIVKERRELEQTFEQRIHALRRKLDS
jgi:flagellar biosynthesis GTPase FlhF